MHEPDNRSAFEDNTDSYVDWVVPDELAACAFPANDDSLTSIAATGVTLLLNLDTEQHDPGRLAIRGLRSVHVPVPDLSAPSPRQIDECLAILEDARLAGERVAVHCRAGLGRTGCVVACYLVGRGMTADQAILAVRRARPGSIETDEQMESIYEYAWRHAPQW